MTTSDFGRRQGYSKASPTFESREHLPEHIRQRVGLLLLENFAGLSRERERFLSAVEGALGLSPELYQWRESIPALVKRYTEGVDVFTGKREMSEEYDDSNVKEHLVRPLLTCEWWEFYEIVENVCAEWGSTGANRESWFAPEFNRLLESFRIPWVLRDGWVIPASANESADELDYVQKFGLLPNSEVASNPVVSLRLAFEALYRKEGGANLSGACTAAWTAWETAKEQAGGNDQVKSEFRELWEAITAWQKLIHAGRHPSRAKKNDRLPTEAETHFIVCLLANAVRLVAPTSETP